MDSEPARAVTELLRQWDEQHTAVAYDPIPVLTRLAEIIESETENFMKKDPDPFDERHPSRTDPECALGQTLKVLFKKDSFMIKLMYDYIRETYYSRLHIRGRNVVELNTVACRLTLDLMPGFDMSIVFQENEMLIHRLLHWATSSPEPLQSYAAGLLAAAMEVQQIATNFRVLNGRLVPLLLRRLHTLRENVHANSSTINNSSSPNTSADTSEGGSNGKHKNVNSITIYHKQVAKCIAYEDDINVEMPERLQQSRKRELSQEDDEEARNGYEGSNGNCDVKVEEVKVVGRRESTSNSSWQQLEPYLIGNIQIHPATDATKQMLMLRYLTSMGEYQEYLTHVFEQNALGLILDYLNVRESRDSRLAFEALKYLASLLCHKKCCIDFINLCGLQKFLNVPRPSIAATGVSICLYYLAYCEDAMERVCLLPPSDINKLVNYALWLLECSHDSGRCHATMFFSLSFQFKVILEEFDRKDGLRKLYNSISTLPILSTEDEASTLTEDEACSAQQIVRHVCVALRRYLEAHLRLRTLKVKRRLGEMVMDIHPSKLSSSYEEIQTNIELLQTLCWIPWLPVDQFVELGGVTLLLRIVSMAYEWTINGSVCRTETLRSALDVISVCCVSTQVQLLLTEKIHLRDTEKTTGINIILGAASGDILLDADVQKAALNVLVNCVCAPLNRTSLSLVRRRVPVRMFARSYEDMTMKIWESVRTNNGILVLLKLMMVKVPITDADRLRGLACRALAGLVRCSTVKQIVSKLPLFTTPQIQTLMRDPILQEKRQEHVMFQKSALEILERLSGRIYLGPEFEASLANMHRASVVAQTRIRYSESELLVLIRQHLAERGYADSARVLQREAALPEDPNVATAPSTPPMPQRRLGSPRPGKSPLACHSNKSDSVVLPDPAKKPVSMNTPRIRKSVSLQIGGPPVPPSPLENKRFQKQISKEPDHAPQSKAHVTLNSIVTEYLYNQHALCKNPMATCPQFDLREPHKCPEPRSSRYWDGSVPHNAVTRIMRREYGDPAAVMSKRAHVHLAHSHFSPSRVMRAQDDASFTYTIFHPTQHQLLAATSNGEVRIFNCFSGIELENSYQVHDSFIYHMQASRDGLLLLASTSNSWRSLSALCSMTTYEHLFQMDEEEYVEFSKMSDDKIIGTKGDIATIFDTRTGGQICTLTPAISNQYAKNRATFNPTDELVLSDGVLWDVNSGKEIHKFDKLNQTHSGVFHPNGMEVIANTEVWDLRTFHLLRTVTTLDRCEVTFNPTHTVLYAMYSGLNSDEKNQFDTSFKTLDASNYSSIATIDVKKNIYSLAVSRCSMQLAIVENSGDFNQMHESCVKLYDIGKKRMQEDEAEEDEEEDLTPGSDNDGSDSGSNDDDLASNLIRNAMLGLAAHSEDESPARRGSPRIHSDSENDGENVSLDFDSISVDFELE